MKNGVYCNTVYIFVQVVRSILYYWYYCCSVQPANGGERCMSSFFCGHELLKYATFVDPEIDSRHLVYIPGLLPFEFARASNYIRRCSILPPYTYVQISRVSLVCRAFLLTL